MMPDDDREGRIFLSTHTPMRESFSCTSFISECRFFFNNAVCRRPPYCDDNTVAFNDVII